MIGYGCTRAPFYVPDPRCRGDDGFHHGIDVALPCRTVLRAGVAGRVIDPTAPVDQDRRTARRPFGCAYESRVPATMS